MNRTRTQFWNLLEPEHLKARAFCRKLMGNRDDGDDLYQDSLVSALTRFDALRKTDAFRPWLFRIIINNFHDRRKEVWWKRFLPLTREIAEIAGSENPDSAYVAQRRLEAAFSVLTAKERALVTLFELEGWKISEIADLTGYSEGNVKVKLSRSRKKMRSALIQSLKKPSVSRQNRTNWSEDEICVVAKSEKG